MPGLDALHEQLSHDHVLVNSRLVRRLRRRLLFISAKERARPVSRRGPSLERCADLSMHMHQPVAHAADNDHGRNGPHHQNWHCPLLALSFALAFKNALVWPIVPGSLQLNLLFSARKRLRPRPISCSMAASSARGRDGDIPGIFGLPGANGNADRERSGIDMNAACQQRFSTWSNAWNVDRELSAIGAVFPRITS
jgi:hypothetical protein